MKPIYEVTNTKILSVIQTHAGNLEVVKEYDLETGIVKKKEIYSSVEGRVELTFVEDVL